MYRYELHMHTRQGSACGQWDIEDMIRAYAAMGYAGAVVTDHFLGGNTRIDRSLPWEELIRAYSAGYHRGRALAKALDFDLLFGVEEGYGGGKEFLVYGIEPEFLLRRPWLRNADTALWSREVHAVGGVLIYAHPFRSRDYIPEPRVLPDMSLADGVEIFNAGNLPGDNQEAFRVFGDADCIRIAGSDAHRGDGGRFCGVDFPRRITTGVQLAQALKERDFSLFLG